MAADTSLAFRNFLTAVSASDAPAAISQRVRKEKMGKTVEPVSGNSGLYQGVKNAVGLIGT